MLSYLLYQGESVYFRHLGIDNDQRERLSSLARPLQGAERVRRVLEQDGTHSPSAYDLPNQEQIGALSSTTRTGMP